MAKPKSSQHIVVSPSKLKTGANKALSEVRDCAYCRRMPDALAKVCNQDGQIKSGDEAKTCELFFDSRRYRMTDTRGAS